MTKSIDVANSRKRIVWLWLTGSSAMDISRQTGLSLSTIYRWIRRWEEERAMDNRRGRRRCSMSQYGHLNRMENSTLSVSLSNFPTVNCHRAVDSSGTNNTRNFGLHYYDHWVRGYFSHQLFLLDFFFYCLVLEQNTQMQQFYDH